MQNAIGHVSNNFPFNVPLGKGKENKKREMSLQSRLMRMLSDRSRRRRLESGEFLKDLVNGGFHFAHTLFHVTHSVEDCSQLVLCIPTDF